MVTSQSQFGIGMNTNNNASESASFMNILLSNNVSSNNISNNQLYNKLINQNHDNHHSSATTTTTDMTMMNAANYLPKTSGPSSPTNLTLEQQNESTTKMMIDQDSTFQLPSLHIPEQLSSLRRTTSYPNKFHHSILQPPPTLSTTLSTTTLSTLKSSCKYCGENNSSSINNNNGIGNNFKVCMFCSSNSNSNGNNNQLNSKTPSPLNNCNNNCNNTITSSPSQSTCNGSIISNRTLSHSNSMEAITDLDRALDGVSPQTPCFLQLDINGLVFELNQSKMNEASDNSTLHNNNQATSTQQHQQHNSNLLSRQLSFNLSSTIPITMNNSNNTVITNINNNNGTTTSTGPQFGNNVTQNNIMQQQQFNNAMLERSLKLSNLQRRNSFVVNNFNRSASSNNLLTAVVNNSLNSAVTSPASPTTNGGATPGNLSPTPSLASLSRKSNSSSSLNNLRGISKQRKTGTLVTETVTTTSSTIHHSVEFPKDFSFVNSSGNTVQQQTSSSSNGNGRNQSWTFYKEEAFENEKKNSKNNFKFHNISFVHVPEQ